MVQEILGIPNSHCVNVLGEAETATNLFDDSLRRCIAVIDEKPTAR
jgi:hypothetical protein